MPDWDSSHLSQSVSAFSNRVEAWTRDVPFLLRQEGRPVANLTTNRTQIRIMEEDWKNSDLAVNWIRNQAKNSSQPFFLYLGLNLPHPYPSESMGENWGSSTFLTSLYWLQKVKKKILRLKKDSLNDDNSERIKKCFFLM